MNRLPVCDKKITMILDFLKAHKNNAYTRRQIAEYLWENYSFRDYKTFDQVLREVGEKLYVHVNNKDTETVQIIQYNTVPYTYQYVGSLHNTKLANYQTAMVFEDEIIVNDIEETVEETDVVDTAEQANLLEDVRAADKIKYYSVLESIEELLQSTSNKTKTICEILQVIIRNS